MKNIINKEESVRFDNRIFSMSEIEFQIVGLFEMHIVKNETEILWEKITMMTNNNKSVAIIIDLYKEGHITMLECESLILLFVRHRQEIWADFIECEKNSTKFKTPVELVKNILNINYEPLKLSVSELKFLNKILRLNNKVTYNIFFDTEMSSFKHLLVVKTFFMKRSILESYTKKEYRDNIDDLKMKTIKDLVCSFIYSKINKIN